MARLHASRNAKEAVTAKARLQSGERINGTDTGGIRPVARVGLGMTYDTNVLLASNVVPTSTDHSTPTIDVDAAGWVSPSVMQTSSTACVRSP